MPEALEPEEIAGLWDKLSHEDRDMVEMWRAVVAQAIRDIGSIDAKTVIDSVNWLNTPDYKEVCGLALLNHAALRRQIEKIIEQPTPLYRKVESSLLADRIMTPQSTSDLSEIF